MNTIATTIATAVAVLLLGTGPALAQTEEAEPPETRMTFKSLALGSTLAEVKASAKLLCAPDKTGEFDTVCIYANSRDRTFATIPATAIKFGFYGDKLDSVDVVLPYAAYQEVKTALDGKFGEVTPYGAARLSTYMMNGDRTYLFVTSDTVISVTAKAGDERRAAWRAKVKQATRNDV